MCTFIFGQAVLVDVNVQQSAISFEVVKQLPFSHVTTQRGDVEDSFTERFTKQL